MTSTAASATAMTRVTATPPLSRSRLLSPNVRTAPVLRVQDPVVDTVVAEWLGGFLGETARNYATDVRDLRNWAASRQLGLLELTRPDVQAYLRHLSTERGLAAATIGRRMTTVIGLLRFCVQEGLLERDPTVGVRRPRVSLSRRHVVLVPSDLPVLLQAATVHSERAGALLSLFLLTGVRACEGLSADVTDRTQLPGAVMLTVRRKGGNFDTFPLPRHTVEAIEQYTVGRRAGPMFLSRSGRRLQRPAAANLLRQVAFSCLPAERANKVSLHATRHLFAVSCAAAGVSVLDIARGMAHSSPRHALRYTQMARELEGHHAGLLLEQAMGLAALTAPS